MLSLPLRPALTVAALVAAGAGAGALGLAAAPAGGAQARAAGSAPTVLRLDGIGPLKLGMSRAAAVKTGWLSGRGTGCPLGGTPLPVTYALDGKGAPAPISGTAQFDGGKLTILTFSKGVRTGNGTAPGRTTTTQMAARYRTAGFKVRAERSELFGGTFVQASRGDVPVIGGFARGKVVQELALPSVPVCE
ncbi:hypothetical protein DSM112329_02305 [Paraconexibacter sp. AEG42_29]|uniref:Uncharacterized protein n=1 Tax=Paraconexibacter sp. AEG42_29 TaxID=2997339 RepID=A0AAU7AV08_9ACTN